MVWSPNQKLVYDNSVQQPPICHAKYEKKNRTKIVGTRVIYFYPTPLPQPGLISCLRPLFIYLYTSLCSIYLCVRWNIQLAWHCFTVRKNQNTYWNKSEKMKTDCYVMVLIGIKIDWFMWALKSVKVEKLLLYSILIGNDSFHITQEPFIRYSAFALWSRLRYDDFWRFGDHQHFW